MTDNDHTETREPEQQIYNCDKHFKTFMNQSNNFDKLKKIFYQHKVETSHLPTNSAQLLKPNQSSLELNIYRGQNRIGTESFDLSPVSKGICYPRITQDMLFMTGHNNYNMVRESSMPSISEFAHFRIIRRKIMTLNPYVVIAICKSLKTSSDYLNAVLRNNFFRDESFCNLTPCTNTVQFCLVDFVLRIRLEDGIEYFDWKSNRLMLKLVHERVELDDTLSWLSTLGGAFSALGDLSITWAEEAGRVTIQQLKLALRLDDPMIISRCHLYAALSLMQCGSLKSAREIVIKEYKFAKSISNKDPKLVNMCIGIFEKLRYLWSINMKR